MQIRKVILGVAIFAFALHMLSLVFTNNLPSPHSGLKGAAWGAGALLETKFGRLLYALLDGFFILVLLKLWRKK
jgi:hypothetical protein